MDEGGGEEGPVSTKTAEFTEEQLDVFERSGYDLFVDSDYVTWLQQNHLHSLPDELQVNTTFNVCSSLVQLPSTLKPLNSTVYSDSDPLEGPPHLLSDSITSTGDSFTSSFKITRETLSAVT